MESVIHGVFWFVTSAFGMSMAATVVAAARELGPDQARRVPALLNPPDSADFPGMRAHINDVASAWHNCKGKPLCSDAVRDVSMTRIFFSENPTNDG